MYTTPLFTLLIVCVGLAYALPPFEIRSGHNAPRSESAAEWLQHLQRQQQSVRSSCRGEAGERLCPLSLPGKRCIQSEQLCDGIPDCPEKEDESSVLCTFLRVNAKFRNGEI